MQLFLNTLASVGGVIAAIILGIAALVLFFKILSRFDVDANSDPLAVSNVVGATEDATVHVLGGRVFENVRVSGLEGGQMYGSDGLVTLEDADGNRFLVREKHIRLIEVPAKRSEDPVAKDESAPDDELA